ncbi:SAVED domain-containing protein [Kordiimonas sp. SCSIO 12603]|uniref:SAVED domain-containing protein n=1 Tax=Kordiimonas sp. SCSIO 12603 TaxID=2829596 RepID=UPI0021035C12|nr:SAVED domain-containing protein [Kordiimonas sp. SCSIO 12603]UTW59656.1 SAVED domain-containing protein [Kordiimonas sp. SCSIO 12603]
MKEVALAVIDYFKTKMLRLSPAALYVYVGMFLISSALSLGLFFDFELSYGPFGSSFSIADRQSWPVGVQYVLLFLGLISFGYGLIIVHPRHLKRVQEATLRQRVVVVEHRGLTFAVNKAVCDAVPPEFLGRREEISIDQTPYVSGNSRVNDPGKSLEEVLHIRRDIDGRVKAVDKNDVTVIYGGLASVPFTFLTGYLIDDDNDVEVMDWDRFNGKWKHIKPTQSEVTEAEIIGLAEAKFADEVILALSISHRCDLQVLADVFPGLPIVHMDTGDYQPNNHWDKKQQGRWAEQFVKLIRTLGSTKKIHLTIAAQNSVVFNLGRTYDRRNSPALYVYQYERDEDPAYPWAIDVPRTGNMAKIVRIGT